MPSVFGRAGTGGTAVASAVAASGNCGCGAGAATSVNGIPPGAVGAAHVPAGEDDPAGSGQAAVVASRAGTVVRRALPRRQLPRPRVAVGNVQPTSTPLPVNVLSTIWLPTGDRSAVAVITSPALRLPAMRLRTNRLSLPPSMPMPVPHPPSACSGVAVCWLAAIRLPAMTEPFAGAVSPGGRSWW